MVHGLLFLDGALIDQAAPVSHFLSHVKASTEML